MNQPDRDDNQRDSNENPLQANSETDRAAIVSPELNADTAAETTHESSRKKEPTVKDWHRPLDIPITEWLVAVFTLIIMGSSIVYTVYAKKQWKVMRESNSINRDSLTSVQRAFVTFDGINLDYGIKSATTQEKYWAFTAVMENSGTTPAISKIQYFSISNELLTEPSPEQFIGKPQDRASGGEIGPRSKKSIGPLVKSDDFILGKYPLISVGSSDFQKFFVSRRMFFWGWTAYRDVFPKTAPHVTEFCEEINGIGAKGTIKQPVPLLNFKECAKYNCTDEHCENYGAIAALIPK